MARPVRAKSGWGSRAVDCRTYGAPTARRGRPHHPPSVQFGRRPSGPRERMGSLLRFPHAGTHEALALPALKRVIRVETLSRSAKALLPPHKCGGSHHRFGQDCALTQRPAFQHRRAPKSVRNVDDLKCVQRNSASGRKATPQGLKPILER